MPSNSADIVTNSAVKFPRVDWRPDTRWEKVLQDLWANRARSALIVLSVAIGVFSVGMVVGARSTILDGLAQQYNATSPANATLVSAPFGDSLLRSMRGLPGVEAAEARYVVDTRIETGNGEWKDLLLFAIPNFSQVRLNRVSHENGAWPPPRNTLLLERNSVGALGAHTGETVVVEVPDGRRRRLEIAGTAHDINQPATTVSGVNYGYVTFSTLAVLGRSRAYNQLYLRVSGDRSNTLHVWSIAKRARDVMQASGTQVYDVLVPQPGKLWVYDAVQSMLLLLTILGVSSLAMSGFLIINSVTAEITMQNRQVGIMKAIGAGRGQIGGLYLATVAVLGFLALCVGIPLGLAGAVGLVGYATKLLDFDAGGLSITPTVIGLEILAGIAIPVGAAVVPILRGSQITVREAMSSHGTGNGPTARSGRLLSGLPLLPDPILLGLGNTFRRKGRLVMTLVAMILGGAIFIAVLSVRASLLHTLSDIFGYQSYDAQITFDRPYPAVQTAAVARSVPGVVKTEGWGLATAERIAAVGAAAANVSIVAPPAGSKLIRPKLLRGRWLRPGDERGIVVNSDVVADEPDLHVGSRVSYMIEDHVTRWIIVGIVRGVQQGPIAYVTLQSLVTVTTHRGLIDRLVAVTASHDAASESTISHSLEERLKHFGFHVNSAVTTDDQRAILGANFDIIVVFLLIMAILLAVVGGLGLMGTMAINVLERTREIGIMRAIGASNRDLRQIVLVEGVVVACLSWVIGAIVALPLAPVLCTAVGDLFIHSPLTYTFSAGGALIWLGGVLGIAIAASLVPAWNACRLTVRDVLAYE